MQDRPQPSDGASGDNDREPAGPEHESESHGFETDATPAGAGTPPGGPEPGQGESIRTVPLEPASSTGPATPRRSARSQAWFWPVVSMVGLVAVLVMNWLANWLPLNDQTTGAISNAHPAYFRPAGWTFLIWSVIYLLLTVVVIYGLLPMGQRDRRIQSIAPVFLVANLANIGWLFGWHWERFALSQLAIVVLLGALAIIFALIRRHANDDMSRFRRLLVKVPFSIYLGWISIATLANLQTWMYDGGWTGGLFGLRGWAIVFLIAGILVAAGFAFFAQEAAYPLVFAWGYAGITAEQWDASRLVSILAGILAVVALVLAGMGSLLSYDTRSGIRPLPKMLRRTRDTSESIDI